MKKFNFFFYITLFLSSVNLFSQGFYAPFSVNQQKTDNLSIAIKSAVDDAKIVDVNISAINQILAEKQERINIRIPFGNTNYDLQLEKFDILNNDTKLVGGTLNGDRNVAQEINFVSYTTPLNDKNSPMFVLSITPGEIAAILIAQGETFVLAKNDRMNNSDYIFYEASKLKIQNNFICGTDALGIPDRITEMQKNLVPGKNDYLTSDIRKANIAIESDYDFYVVMNGTQNAINYILRLMAPVSAIYTRDINVQLKITYLRVWEISADPYPDATSSSTVLNAFRSYWNANMGSVQRTVAHFITNRPGGLGGVAWVDVLCNNVNSGYGYAFSDIDVALNPLPSYSWDCMVVAHETGHNFGSPHTHSCSWPGGPIDSCYATEGGCYSGPPIPRVGTIMSYCHLNGSISLSQGFGPLPSQLMRNRAEIAPCMTSSTGYVVALPNGGELYRSGNNVYVVWGTSNSGNVDIDYTTNNGSSWINIQSNVAADQKTINWIVPYGPTTTQAKLRVYQSGNPGTADMSDSAFQIRPNIGSFNMISPLQFSRFNVYSNDTSKVNFTWSNAGLLPEMKYKIFLRNFSNTLTYTVNSNNNGSDTSVSITLGVLDSLAATWGANPGDSIRGRWFVKAYSQLDSANPTSSSFLITFNRSIIGINPISTVIPKEYFVNPNYPNPFNPVTKIKFGLPKESFVKITVYDILGKEVSILANQQLKAGEFEVDWNAESFPSGVYFYRVEAGDFVKTSKMMLIK